MNSSKVGKAFRKFKTDLVRKGISHLYLSGEGVEIGGLHNPLSVPRKASVRYVDRMSAEELRKQYPELNDKRLVHVDIIDDGERLETISDSTQDFVIANHFLEHSENPLNAVRNMLRVLKNNGILYAALPDKRYTFDAGRPVTPLAHILDDYAQGPEHSRLSHFHEWVRLVDGVSDAAEITAKAAALLDLNYSIHFHVWTQKEMLELFLHISQSYRLDFEVILKNGDESIFILRKLEQVEP